MSKASAIKTVLKVQLHQVKMQQRVLARETKREADEKNRLKTLQVYLKEYQEKLRHISINSNLRENHRLFLIELAHNIEKQQQTIVAVTAQVNVARKRLMELQQRADILAELLERFVSNEEKLLSAKEQKLLDEIAGQQFVRKER